jgi:hypothetical protein
MEVLGIGEKDQEALWKVLTAILLLGIYPIYNLLIHLKRFIFNSSRLSSLSRLASYACFGCANTL